MSEKKAIVFVLDDGYADKALPAILDVWVLGQEVPGLHYARGKP